MAEHRAGDRVTITITGATVEDITATEDGPTMVILTDTDAHVVVPVNDPAVTIAQTTPLHWPPLIKDVWADRDDDPWICGPADRLTLGDTTWPVGEVLRECGPLRLVYRKPAGGES